jgi:hypothetical protein
MVVFKRLMAFAGIAVLGLALAACSRTITRVEQVTAGPQTCFECHSDTSTFLVAATQQWENSRHASGETLNEKDGECKNCHTSEGFLAVASGTTIPDVVENPTSIHCFTCHAPHTNGDFSTRATSVAQKTLMNGVTYDLRGGNICLACHRSRRDVRTYVADAARPKAMSNRFGPHHGPQGDMLIGSNGYEFAGYTYTQSTHRSVTEDGCLDCHFKTTLQNRVGGHSFNMVWGEDEILNTAACERCHGAVEDFSEVRAGTPFCQDSVAALAADLRTRLLTAKLITVADGLATPAKEMASVDSCGAVYNLMLYQEDRSGGVHNPKYISGLLKSAIAYMSRTPSPGMTAAHVQRAMSDPRGRR